MNAGSSRTLELSGSLTINEISVLKENILRSLSDCRELSLAFSAVADVDIAFLQLLESARISARRSGKTIRLAAPAQGPLLVALRRAGLDASFDQAAFWFPGPSFWLQGAEAA